MDFYGIIELVGKVIDAAGVAAIVVGVLYAAGNAAVRGLRHQHPVYTQFRRILGRGILLGLELLVAADIIRTVAVTPTLESVAVLGAIVLIRTFLSFSLELEITGRWPWQKKAGGVADGSPVADSAGDGAMVESTAGDGAAGASLKVPDGTHLVDPAQ